MSGYVRAQRARFEHPMFRATKASPYCRGYAWDWLVAYAAWRDTKTLIKGRVVTLRRGQLSFSVRFLAERWAWSKSAVDRFLSQLEAEAMIGTESGTGQLVITICNYDRYQSGADADGTEDGTEWGISQTPGFRESNMKNVRTRTGTETVAAQQDTSDCSDNLFGSGNVHVADANWDRSGTGAGQERDKEERREERKKGRREVRTPHTPHSVATAAAAPSALVAEFERVWPHYPRRVGIGQARKAWIKARRTATYEEITRGLRAFIPAIRGTPTDKIPHFSTWLNGERWLDDHSAAANRPRTSTEDLDHLARIDTPDELAALMPPTLRLISK